MSGLPRPVYGLAAGWADYARLLLRDIMQDAHRNEAGRRYQANWYGAESQPGLSKGCRANYPDPTPDLEDSDDDISEIQMEIAHLAQCDSDYVTRYYGSFVKGYKLWISTSHRSIASCDKFPNAPPALLVM